MVRCPLEDVIELSKLQKTMKIREAWLSMGWQGVWHDWVTDNSNRVNQSDFSGERISSFFWLAIIKTEDWPSKNSLSSGSETEGTERQNGDKSRDVGLN